MFLRLPEIRAPRIHLGSFFRKSRTTTASDQSIRDLWRHIRLVLRYDNKTPKGQKDQAKVLAALSRPPRFRLSDIQKSLRNIKLYLQLFFRRPHKEDPDSIPGVYQNSFSKRLLRELRRDFSNTWLSMAPYIEQYWKSVAVFIAFSPLFFELFLQGTSLMTWSMLQLRERIMVTSSRDNVILCVGDSYTSGRFTSSQIRPYTDFLREMSKRKVVNYSSDFLSTDKLLENLPALLQKQRPAAVYIMVGINDFLNSDPGETIAEQGLPQQTQRYIRTALFVNRLRKENPLSALFDTFIAPAPFFLKSPEEDKRDIHFSNTDFYRFLTSSRLPPLFPLEKPLYFHQGSMIFRSGGNLQKEHEILKYSTRENLVFQESDGKKSARIWEWNNGVLALNGERYEDINLYTDNQGQNDPLDFTERAAGEFSSWDQLNRGALDLAQSMFTQELASSPDVFAHAGLAEFYFQTGSHAEAKKQIFWLSSRYQTHPNLRTARALLRVYALENSVKDTLTMTLSVLRQFPADPWIWKDFAWYAHLSHRPDFASRAIGRALDLAPAAMPVLRAEILRTQSEIILPADPQKALESLMQSFLLDDKEELFVQSLQGGYLQYKTLNIQKTLAAISCPAETKARMLHLIDQGLDANMAGKASALRSRLKEIARVCQQYGARPVFVTYPWPYPVIGETMRRVAEETDSGWLNLSTRFESLLNNPERRKKILKEGNFIDGASQKIAEAIAGDLRFRQPD